MKTVLFTKLLKHLSWNYLGNRTAWLIGDITSSIGDKIDEIVPVVGGVAGDLIGNPLNDTTTHLSEEQIEGLREIFGDSIRYDEVVINDSSLLADLNSNFNENGNSRPFVLGNTINSDGTLDDRELIHEMMHVYQYNRFGWDYLTMAGENRNYDYDYSELERIANDPNISGLRLDQFGLEQQGEIVADYYELTQFNGTGDMTLRDGTLVNEHNIDTIMATYEPYIDEIQNTEPREGASKEFDEAGEEIIRETGEAGEEILGETREAAGEINEQLQDGDYLGAAGETLEGAAEVTGEALEGAAEIFGEGIEGAAETGWELGKDGVGNIADGASDLWNWATGDDD